ncbi:tRNA-dependent cyclodipeptide synthase, partial [Bacillus subtilis]
MTGMVTERRSVHFIAEALTENCREIFERRRHVLVGISPFNS